LEVGIQEGVSFSKGMLNVKTQGFLPDVLVKSSGRGKGWVGEDTIFCVGDGAPQGVKISPFKA
jgi:hypothetical protein